MVYVFNNCIMVQTAQNDKVIVEMVRDICSWVGIPLTCKTDKGEIDEYLDALEEHGSHILDTVR